MNDLLNQPSKLNQQSLKLDNYKRYETSGVIVEAIQWIGGNFNNVNAFITSKDFNWDALEIGDYVVNNLIGQFYICKKSIFETGYNKLNAKKIKEKTNTPNSL